MEPGTEGSNFPPRVKQPLDGYHRQLREQRQSQDGDSRSYMPSKGSFSIPNRPNRWRISDSADASGSSYQHVASFFDSERLASAQPKDEVRGQEPRRGNADGPLVRWPFLGSIRSTASSIISRTPSRSTTRRTPPQPSSPIPGSEMTSNEEARLPWRPSLLRRRVLACFALLFAILIAAVEVVLFISRRNDGLHNSNDVARYLWQYGTTLFFAITAAVWARVEYQAKASAPWLRMSKGSTDADKSLLLDYISLSEPWVLIKAVKNRDLLVAGPVIGGLFLKAAIILSTALITPTLIRTSSDSFDITLVADFSEDNAGLRNVGALPYLTMAALQTTNMSFPNGISSRAAYQPITTPEGSPDVLNTTVNGFVGAMDCQSAQLTLRTIRYMGDFRIQLNLTASSDQCTSSQVIQTTQFATDSSLSKRFLAFRPGSCDGSTDIEDQRIVVISGGLSVDTDSIDGDEESTTTRLEGELFELTAFICSPTYAITKVALTKNATDLVSLNITGPANSTRDGVHPWDIARAVFKSFGDRQEAGPSLFTAVMQLYENDVILDADDPMLASLAMRAKESGQVPDANELKDSDILQGLAQDLYAQYSALVARFSMMDATSSQSTAAVEKDRWRLIVQQIPAHILVGLLGVCLLVTITAMFLAPVDGFLPRDPGSIIDTATLLAHSRALMQCLQGTGGAHNGILKERLAGSSYSAGVKSYDDGASSDLGCFHIFGGTAPTKTYPSRIDQTGWRQPVALTGIIRLLFVIILSCVIIGFEISLRSTERGDGWRFISNDGAYIAWTVIPALLLLSLALYVETVDSWTRIVAPFTNLYYESEYSDSVGLNLIDRWKLAAWWKALKMRDFNVMATISGVLFASLLAVAAAALFKPVLIDIEIEVALAGQDFFANSLAFSEDDPICIDCNNDTAMASLILNANASHPPFTFEDLNLQTVRMEGPGSTDADLQIAVVLPAVRPNMTCRLYMSSEISANITIGSIDELINPLRIDVDGEPCRGETELRSSNAIISTSFGPSGEPLDDNSFFGAGIGKTNATAQCSDWLYVWGQLANARSTDISVSNKGALACNESIMAIDASVVLHGPHLRINEADPPVVNEQSYRGTSVPLPTLNYTLLANTSTANLFDHFFVTLGSSRIGLATELMGDPSQDAAAQVQAAILRQHSIIRAQSLNFKSRRHLSASGRFPLADGTLIMSGLNPDASVSEAVPTFNGNIVTPQIRLRQDVVATRILQCLLGVVFIFHLVSWIFTPRTILPRWPTSIASVAALLADGNLIGFLPRVAEWQSKQDLEDVFCSGNEMMRFELGWEPPARHKKRHKGSKKEYGTFGIRVTQVHRADNMLDLRPLPLPPTELQPQILQPVGVRRVASSTLASAGIPEEASYQESIRRPVRPDFARKGSAHGSAKNWWA